MSSFVRAHALVIGIANYVKIKSLPAAVTRDAADMAAVLTDRDACSLDPACVHLLSDAHASARRIRDTLVDLAKRISPDEAFIFYFSGHGDRRGSSGAERSYLLAHDSDLAQLETTALSDSEIFDLLGKIRSTRQLIILDACHAGGVGTLKTGGGEEKTSPKGVGTAVLSLLSSGAGRVVLASSRADEYSHIPPGWENSVFTDSLLRALRGDARDKGDGTIGVFDLFDFVSNDVPTHEPNQHPVFKADNLEANFSVAAHATSRRKSPGPSAMPVIVTARLFGSLYPQGPLENDIWSRAGGDIARLSLAGNGLAQWHRAIQLIANGGGGLTMGNLLEEAAGDFPGHLELSTLLADAT